jgi:hypothetical protein
MVPPQTRVLDRFGHAPGASLGDDSVIEMSKPSSGARPKRLSRDVGGF